MAASAKRLIPGKRVDRFSVFLWLLFAAGGLFAQTVPSPESVLGYKPGADYHLTRYTESLAYFQKLAAATDKLRLERVGRTSEGQDWYIAVISSPENLKNIDRYRDIARRIALVQDLNDESARKLAREGKAIVHVDGGLHSTECAGAEHTIQLAYDLVAGANDPQIQFILDNVVLVLWFSLNPDGQNMVADWYRRNLGTEFEISPMPWLYQKYVGHDNNRDGYMNNMTESQAVTRVAVEQWFPMVYYNHHQTAPFPARIWIPPFAEPISSNVHPLMWRWTNVFGTAMASYLDQHGMPGSVHRTGFDDWYPGFIDGVNNYRNTISFLTETALYRYATPRFYTVQDFPKEYQELRQEVFYSSPWKGGWWRLGDAVRYMVGASISVLDTAAKYREEIIYNRYQAGRDVIRRFAKEPPFAFIVPQRQRDPQTAALMVEKLRINGIRIQQAAQPVTANGREYPAGSWVILMDQPFALLVKELMEVQKYPDLRVSPGGEPDLPYDVAGWTLPFQMGVEVVSVSAPLTQDFRGRLRPLDKVTPPAAAVEGSGNSFVFDHQSNDVFRAINRILKAGGNVSFAKKELTAGKTRLVPGAVVAAGISQQQIQSISSELSLPVQAVSTVSDPVTAVKAPRIGIYSSWVANIDEGWTRWLLEQFEFPYKDVHNAEIQSGHLRDSYDVLIFAEAGAATIMDGHAVGTVPGEYVGGIGETGLIKVREFVRDGGTLLMLGNASNFAIERFNLSVKNVLTGLKNTEFFCAGSILRTEVKDAGHPLTYGLPPDPAVFFARNAAFETDRDFKGSVLLTYPKDDNPLMSGYLLHPEKIQGKIAALDAVYGRGHIILTGFRPQWRGQPHMMFKLLFNSLYYFGPAAEAAAAAAQPARASLETDWAKITDAVHAELQKVLAQGQKLAGARGAQALEEAKQYDALVQQFQTVQMAAIDEFKGRAGARAGGRLDEYKTQLKAALLDIRGKDYAAVKFTFTDLMSQFRLSTLEQEIRDLVK
jgi:hypothetical protein